VGEEAAGEREVGGGAAVQAAEGQDTVGSEALGAAAGLAQHGVQPRPLALLLASETLYRHLGAEDYQDRLRIDTPEGVELSVELAGLGSRFAAGLLVRGALLGLVGILAALIGDLGSAVFYVAVFAVLYPYDVAFEVLGGGRTPGKRAAHLRVLRADGRPVDLTASAIRNLVRLVEGLPLLYLPAAISILSTARNQRLGDLAAGTVVVREVRAAEPEPMPRFLLSAPPTGPLDTTRVTAEDLAAVNDFLARRANLEPAVRADLAARLAQAIGPRVGGGVDGLGAELVLERVAADKRDRQ
jgi:uncharacterized RDD family membrane protein YckC